MGNSKSDRMLLIGMGISIALIGVGIFIKVAFGENVIEFVLAGIGVGGGNGALSTARSLIVDAPIRQSYAALDVQKQAKEAGVPASVPPGLQTWTPPNEGG